MDSKSLMIGDWVYCFDPDEPNDKQINNVSAVRVEYNEGAIKFEQFTDWFEEGWFAPIPLTPEILEKNGFETKFGYSKYNDEDDFFLVTWNSISHHLRVRTFDNDCAFDKDHIDYVHELQHALRLCGMNDLADNFKI